jgi:hypothetical protein
LKLSKLTGSHINPRSGRATIPRTVVSQRNVLSLSLPGLSSSGLAGIVQSSGNLWRRALFNGASNKAASEEVFACLAGSDAIPEDGEDYFQIGVSLLLTMIDHGRRKSAMFE